MNSTHERGRPGWPPPARRGSVALGGLLWLIALSLFVLPFALGHRDVTDWKAPDPGRKLDYADEDDTTRDVPFLEDVAELQEYGAQEGWDLGPGLDPVISEASLRHFGRDYRGYFAPDHETYQAMFVEAAEEPYVQHAVSSRPIDLAAAASSGLFDVARLEAGERTYLRQCAGCHGLAGDGGGPAARYLAPRPRNFRKGNFKFTTTTWGSRPRHADLFRTVTQGLVGSAMPPFDLLPEQKRWDVVEYVRFLAVQGEFEQTMLAYAESDEELPDPDQVAAAVISHWSPLVEQYPASEEPPADAASVARGKELFLSQSASCSACHGATGKGDGPTADAYRDVWGYPIRPRDLTTGKLRAGTAGKELWVLIAHGIKGTPMPGQIGALSSEDIWHLVHFVQSVAGGAAGEN